jgi:hypothetical protein
MKFVLNILIHMHSVIAQVYKKTRHATLYTLDQLMFAGGIGIELARTWDLGIAVEIWGSWPALP